VLFRSELARRFARTLNAPLFFSTTSRLLVELNRSVHHPALFSIATKDCPPDVRDSILERYYWPYRKSVEEAIRKQVVQGKCVLHLSVHSFTPVLDGVVRQADVGFLYDPKRSVERQFAERWREYVRVVPNKVMSESRANKFAHGTRTGESRANKFAHATRTKLVQGTRTGKARANKLAHATRTKLVQGTRTTLPLASQTRCYGLTVPEVMERLRVRRNYPYRGSADGFTTYLRTCFPPFRYLGIELEVNQRFVRSDRREWLCVQDALVRSLAMVLARRRHRA